MPAFIFRAASHWLSGAKELCAEPLIPHRIGHAVNCLQKLNVLSMHTVKKGQRAWPLTFMAAWELETLQHIILKKLFITLQKFMSPQVHICS